MEAETEAIHVVKDVPVVKKFREEAKDETHCHLQLHGYFEDGLCTYYR